MNHIETLRALGISQRQLARLLGQDEGSFRQQLRGARPMPADIRAWLDSLAAWLAANPAPARPQRPHTPSATFPVR